MMLIKKVAEMEIEKQFKKCPKCFCRMEKKKRKCIQCQTLMSVSKESDEKQASVGDFKTKPSMYKFSSESKKTFSQKAVKFGHVESVNNGDPHEIILLDPFFVNPNSIENIKLILRYIGKKANIMKDNYARGH